MDILCSFLRKPDLLCKDKHKIIDIKNIDISSTYIRNKLNNKTITRYIDKEILEYIKKENLYS